MKSIDRILARRYAAAFDSLHTDAQQALAASQDLIAAARALAQAKKYMQDPAVTIAAKTAFIQQTLGKENQVSAFICELLQAKRYYLLEDCAAFVQYLADKRLGIVRAEVQTAFELSDEQKRKVEQTLSGLTAAKAQATFTVQPELIGGLCARLEDTLIDGSIKGQFEKLKEEITK